MKLTPLFASRSTFGVSTYAPQNLAAYARTEPFDRRAARPRAGNRTSENPWCLNCGLRSSAITNTIGRRAAWLCPSSSRMLNDTQAMTHETMNRSIVNTHARLDGERWTSKSNSSDRPTPLRRSLIGACSWEHAQCHTAVATEEIVWDGPRRLVRSDTAVRARG